MKTRSIIYSIIQIVVVAAILYGGWFYYHHLMDTAPKNKKRERPERISKVKIQKLQPGTEQIFINTSGTVIPERMLSLKPQVSGKIIKIHPELHTGGMIKKGEVLAEIEQEDYQIAVTRAENKLSQAKFAYRLELGEQDVAKYEWNFLDKKDDISLLEKELILRIPHLEKARSDIKAAEAELKHAKLNLERCKVRAPFDLMVIERMVTEGAQVNSQSVIAELVAADTFWVEAAIPYQQLQWLSPDNGKTIIIPASDTSGTAWQGQFIRQRPGISPGARRARIIIEIKKPLTQNSSPLLLNSFVKVRIPGPVVQEVYKVPNTAFHDGSKLYLFSEENRLEIRKVTPLWTDDNFVYIIDNLNEGEQLILSPLSTIIPGMKLEIAENTMERKL